MKINWGTVGLTAVGAAVAVAWTAWATHGSSIARFLSASDLDAGVWGDSFGALNTLFGAAGFVAVAVTLFAQRKALRVQQNEIEDARLEQHRHRFETTFFELLGLMRELRQNLDFHIDLGLGRGQTVVSFGAIKAAVQAVDERLALREMYPSTAEPLSDQMLGSWYEETVFRRSEVGPYFRVIYTMLDRLRTDRIVTDDERVRYSKLLRSQLNGDEITLAALNGLSSVSKDFRELLTQFHMLKYLPPGRMRTALEAIYPPQAFAPRDDWPT